MKRQKEVSLFYVRLKELSELQGKSLNWVEQKLGYPRNALNNYKNVRSPSAQRLLDLSQYFDVTPEYLLGQRRTAFPLNLSSYFERLTDQEKRQIFIISQTWMLETIQRTLLQLSDKEQKNL